MLGKVRLCVRSRLGLVQGEQPSRDQALMALSTGQHLERLASISLLFQAQPLTPHEICLLVSLKLFPDKSSCGIGIFELSPGGDFTLRSSFGIPEKSKVAWCTYSITATSPVVEAMRTSETVFVSSAQEMISRYPEHSACHEAETLYSVIAVPIRKLGNSLGALLITGSDVEEDTDCRQFLEIVAGLVALKLNPNTASVQNSPGSKSYPMLDDALTKRELKVQRMMKQGKTNHEIGEALGYSESTIRQDAVSMFIKLGVRDRKSAGELLEDQ